MALLRLVPPPLVFPVRVELLGPVFALPAQFLDPVLTLFAPPLEALGPFPVLLGRLQGPLLVSLTPVVFAELCRVRLPAQVGIQLASLVGLLQRFLRVITQHVPRLAQLAAAELTALGFQHLVMTLPVSADQLLVLQLLILAVPLVAGP